MSDKFKLGDRVRYLGRKDMWQPTGSVQGNEHISDDIFTNVVWDKNPNYFQVDGRFIDSSLEKIEMSVWEQLKKAKEEVKRLEKRLEGLTDSGAFLVKNNCTGALSYVLHNKGDTVFRYSKTGDVYEDSLDDLINHFTIIRKIDPRELCFS